jgi:hypothetical protein
MPAAVVYALFDPRDLYLPRYIGTTTRNPTRRMFEHLVESFDSPNRPVCKWISGLYQEGFVPKVKVYQEISDASESSKLEKSWIRFFHPLGCLLNAVGTGVAGPNHKVSESNRLKTIERNKRGWTPSMRENWTLAMKGKKWTEERSQKAAVNPNIIRRNQILVARNKAHPTSTKPVLCVETGRIYPSLKECIAVTGFNQGWFSEKMRNGRPYKGLHYTHNIQ